MRFGAHVSAAGGLELAPERAGELNLEVFQFFSRPPQGGRVGPISQETAKKFRAACEKHGFDTCYVHAPFIINLASSEERIRSSSVDILRQELERSSRLGAKALMFHPGSAAKVGEAVGEKLVIAGVRNILKGYRGTARFLIEISAGAGAVVADRFEEVRRLLDGVNDDRLAVCFDTAHAFASGYDLRTAKAVKETMGEFDRVVGFDRLLLSHCNDSKVELGARKDRHEAIGRGHIGRAGFRALLAHPRFSKLDLILETEPEGWKKDLNTLRSLRPSATKRRRSS